MYDGTNYGTIRTEFLQRKGVVRFPACNGNTETSMMLGIPVKERGLSKRPGLAKRVDAAGTTQKYGSLTFPLAVVPTLSWYLMNSIPIVRIVDHSAALSSVPSHSRVSQ